MAGAGGLEPPNAGIKILCLSHLTTPQGGKTSPSKIHAPQGVYRGNDAKAF